MRVPPIEAVKTALHATLSRKMEAFAVVERPIMRCPCALIRQAAIGILRLLQTPRQIACIAGMIGMVVLGEPYKGGADVRGRRGAEYAENLIEIALAHRGVRELTKARIAAMRLPTESCAANRSRPRSPPPRC